MANNLIRRFVNQHIDSDRPLTVRLEALRTAFQEGLDQDKADLFSELAMVALVGRDIFMSNKEQDQ